MFQNVTVRGARGHPRVQQNGSCLAPWGDKTILIFSRVSFYRWGTFQNPIAHFLTF